MYIVAIGWAYVILMMVVTASSVGKALSILLFLGVIPLGLFIYVADASIRRRRAEQSSMVADQRPDEHHTADSQTDQH
ncbi:MAG: hypothetical protein ABL877_05655 [Thiobacillus sp.]